LSKHWLLSVTYTEAWPSCELASLLGRGDRFVSNNVMGNFEAFVVADGEGWQRFKMQVLHQQHKNL
jgi:hypothetical protein